MHSILDDRRRRRDLEKAFWQEIEQSRRVAHQPIPLAGTGLYVAEGMLIDHQELKGVGDPVFGMAGFATYDDIINSLSVNARGQQISFRKASITSVVSNINSTWQATGTPGVGTFGTSLTGRSIDNTFAAALQFANATGGRFKHLLSVGIGSTVSLGTVLLYDRVYEYPFTGTATSGTFSVPTLVARDMNGATSGDGLMMFLENFSATATAAVTVTPTYTNQAGTGSKTNAFTSIATGAVAGQVANGPAGNFFVALASGDTGVRSIQSYTLSASLLAANMCFVLGRPLCYVPMLAGNSYVERDLVLQLAQMPRLYDGTAMSFLILNNSTTCPLHGQVMMSEN